MPSRIASRDRTRDGGREKPRMAQVHSRSREAALRRHRLSSRAAEESTWQAYDASNKLHLDAPTGNLRASLSNDSYDVVGLLKGIQEFLHTSHSIWETKRYQLP